MKLLNDQTYNLMKQKSGNWDSLVSTLFQETEVQQEQQTPETVIALIENGQNNSEDHDQIDTLKSEMQAKDQKIQQLLSTIEELRKTPASAAVPAVTHEAAAAVEDIKEFAKAHEADTAAIMAKAKEVGFF